MSRKKAAPTSIDGFGSIYQPKYKDRHGIVRQSSVWWIRYGTGAGQVRRNLKTTDQGEAFEQLVTTAGKRVAGTIRDARPETVTIGECLSLLLEHYKGLRTYVDVECRARRRLQPEFGAVRVRDLRRAHLDAFVQKLEADELEPSTINRHLSNLHKALELGREHELVNVIPKLSLIHI